MPKPLTQTLTPEKALIFRRTHCRNVPWILRNGLHCRRSNRPDPDFVGLGNPDLIERRPHRPVPIDPGGTLDDYLRFDFTPFSPMLDNIRTGYGGIGKRRSEEIVILVSSLPALEEKNIRYVFTDRHAFLQSALFFSHRGELGNVAWDLLRRRDLPRDPEEPTKLERYQAEALVYRFLPVDGLLGLACSTAGVQRELDADLGELGLDLKTVVRPGWYFR